MALFNALFPVLGLVDAGKKIVNKIKEPKKEKTAQSMVFPLNAEGEKAMKKKYEPTPKQKAIAQVQKQFGGDPFPEGSIGGGIKKVISDIFPLLPAAEQAAKERSLTPFKTYAQGFKEVQKEKNKIFKEGLSPTATKEQRDLLNQEMLSMIDVGASGSIKQTGKKVVEEVAPVIKKEATTLFQRVVGGVEKMADNTSAFDPKKYVEENVAKRELARKAEEPTFLKKVSNVYNTLKRKIVESNAPIEDTIREAEKKGGFEILPKADISHQIDKVYRTPQIASQFIKDNGLEEVIKSADDLDNVSEYLIAKQARDVEARGIKTGRDAEKDTALIDAFKEQYEPMAQKVNQYSQKLLDYSVDRGLISKELADELKVRYPNYVPLNRVFNELELDNMAHGQPGGTASLSKQTVVQRLEGSEREIEDPFASLLVKTNDAFAQGERNKAAQILTSYEKLPGNPFGLRLMKEGEKIPAGQSTVSVFRNGQKEQWLVNRDIAEAAKRLTVEQTNILQKILTFPIRIAKAGITGLNLPFIGANVASDQLFATITSKHTRSTANPAVFIKALMSTLKHDGLYDDWVRSGAGGTSFDILRDQPRKTVSNIRAGKSTLSKIKYNVTHPGQLLRAIENVVGKGEELTRIQQFEGTRKALLKQGRTAQDAEILAAKASRGNTANFFRKGDWGNAVQGMFLYLNAGIQGSRAWVQRMAKNPVKTSLKLTTTLLMPTAILTAYNLNDPKRKEAYEDIAEYEKENNFILIPPNPTKDEDGKWNVIKIKIPPGISKLTIPVRRALEDMNGVNEFKFAEFANSLLTSPLPFDVTKVDEKGKVGVDTNSILSTMTPQAIKPSIESFANKNFFTGYPIVPDSMEGLSPELQVRDNTSGSARKIGSVLNMSPIKVEEFIRATAGGVGAQSLNLVDRVLAGAGVIPKEQVGGQAILESIAGRFTKARGGESEQKSIRELSSILKEQADESFRTTQEAELIHKELKGLSSEEANKKYKQIKEKDPALARKIKTITQDEKLGIDYDDRLLKRLGVENKARATFIHEKAKTFATPEERNAYIKDLKNKKIITKEVQKQIKELIAKEKAE